MRAATIIVRRATAHMQPTREPEESRWSRPPEDETPSKSAAKTAAQNWLSALLSLGTQGSPKAAAVVITAEAQHATTLAPDGTEHGAPVPHRVTQPEEEEGLLAAEMVEGRDTNPLIMCRDARSSSRLASPKRSWKSRTPEDETPSKSAAETAAPIRSSALLSPGTPGSPKAAVIVVTADAHHTNTLCHMIRSPEGRRRDMG